MLYRGFKDANKHQKKMMEVKDVLRAQLIAMVREYYMAAFPKRVFEPGETYIPYAGRVFNSDELVNLVLSSLDFWLTAGPFAKQFEKEFAELFGVQHVLLVNSGSSANLLALACLTSRELTRRLHQGDEVITVAAGFPTTINPIVQCGMVPVFVDVTVPTYNIDVSQLDAALSERTRAIILAHTLGNPFNVAVVVDFAKIHNLWLIEDCCDAIGATYHEKQVGTFGDLATVSFYPAHHITMGEGGCILTDSLVLKTLVQSYRDWGRDCWCEPGKDDTCGKRVEGQWGELPYGYDHKYVYSHIGYNMKLTDMQAAIGLPQLKKLHRFIEDRRRNFKALYEGLRDMGDYFILPEATAGSKPSWFGFPLAVRPDAPFTRNLVTKYLEYKKIATRLLFGGNMVRQPAYCDSSIKYRVIGNLKNSDYVMNNVFWVGVYSGITDEMLKYMLDCFHKMPMEISK